MLRLRFFCDLLGLVVDFFAIESDVVIEVVVDLNSSHFALPINNNFYQYNSILFTYQLRPTIKFYQGSTVFKGTCELI